MQTRIGRYAIESEIGKGGMGIVYRARDERLGKTVAVKMLSGAKLGDREGRSRFRHEARAAAVLNHPSIVTVYDYDEHEGVPFIVYEYVEGKTLDQSISEGKLSLAQILDIGRQVSEGLAYAHDLGILHRDIKPQNIIVTSEGRVKILDFGLAKRIRVEFESSDGAHFESTTVATAAGTIVGTVQYMSPEQIVGEELDGRTDIFSLGIVLYEMASGKNPFHGDSFASTVGKIMSLEAPAVEPISGLRSRELQQIILRCLEKRREDRYESAAELKEELDALREAVPGERPSLRRRSVEADAGLIPRRVARVCLMLLQILYLCIYGYALYYYWDVHLSISGFAASVSGEGFVHGMAFWIGVAYLVTGCCGIAVRLFLMASLAFDDPETGYQFRKLFPWLFLLDEIWALSPLLLIGRWPAGLTIICAILLAYLPFSHRNLIRNSYRTV